MRIFLRNGHPDTVTVFRVPRARSSLTKLCDQAEVAAEIETRDGRIKELQAAVMTPEKARAEYAAQQKLIANVKDMLPTMEVPEDVDTNKFLADALRQLENNGPATKAAISAVLDGVAIDQAKPDDLKRAVRTIHASTMADKQHGDAHRRNVQIGRDIFAHDSAGQSRPSGRDAWVHRLEHMQDTGNDENLEEL